MAGISWFGAGPRQDSRGRYVLLQADNSVRPCSVQFEEPAPEAVVGLGLERRDQLGGEIRCDRPHEAEAVLLDLRVVLAHHPHAAIEGTGHGGMLCRIRSMVWNPFGRGSPQIPATLRQTIGSCPRESNCSPSCSAKSW